MSSDSSTPSVTPDDDNGPNVALWAVIALVAVAACGIAGFFIAKQAQGLGCQASSCTQTCNKGQPCSECPPIQCAKFEPARWPSADTAKVPKNDADPDFQVCAVRDGTCTAPVGTPIFYGVGGAYAKKEATQTETVCSPTFFGGDPWPGRDKACWIPKSYPPVPGFFENDLNYIKCANNGASCAAPVNSSIFYGSQGTYAKKMATQNSTLCTGAFFDDPLVNLNKACYIRKPAPDIPPTK